MPELTVIYWRAIPAQVTAVDGDASARAQLHERFQKAIDAAAMRAGLVEMDAYLAEWRQVVRPCGGDLEAEVAKEAERLEHAYGADVVRRLVRAGGLESDGGAGS